MRHCCVIGGTGFIGSYVVDTLLARGRRVTVVGRNPIPTRPLPASVVYHAGDYGDSYFLREVLQGVDEIVCLAYTTVPKTSFDDPVNDIFGNLPATVRLFETACALGICKLVFISSGGTVYGRVTHLPITEECPAKPISPYGITKLALENYAFMFHVTHDLPVVCVRPSNAYGPCQTPFAGQGLIATAIASLMLGREILLYGENGTIRDYIHVRDVAAGIVAALEHGRAGECYNIGSGTGRTSREIIDVVCALAREAGYEAPTRILPERRFDVPANVLDSGKLHAESGWQPTIKFDEGLRETWRWYAETTKRDTLCR